MLNWKVKNVIKIEKTEVVGWEPAIRGMRNPMNSWEKSDSFICKEHGAMTNEEIEAECGKCPKCDGCDIYDREPHFIVGLNDLKLMTTLRNAGTADRKFMRMITVYVDLTAPLYWWKEFKTYRAGKRFGDDEPDVFIIHEDYLEYDIEMNSCSTMHKIHAKEFTLDDFSHEHLTSETDGLWVNADGKDFMCSAYDFCTITCDVLNFYRRKYLETKDKKYWWQMIQLLPTSYNQKRTVMLNYEVLANMYKSRKNHKLDEWHDFCHWIESLPYSELITG
mgnify:CR=1 FL=1